MALRDDRLPEETDFARLKWGKSSHSGNANDANCVEVSRTPAAVLVRDSKVSSVALGFTFAAWKAFLEHSRDH
ncbi:DUF397 domain-containing protein [Amycolatopsis thailandensis]|uniref:DUF397 domain-containing protein n=1 Tax=Amycolatopsis thailandensis TaxID=589330 RepID=UPI0037B7BD8F